MRAVRFGLPGCAALVAVTSAWAQVRTTGAITGTVKETSDAVVPGATVVLKDEGTNATQGAVTNTSGLFRFPGRTTGAFRSPSSSKASSRPRSTRSSSRHQQLLEWGRRWSMNPPSRKDANCRVHLNAEFSVLFHLARADKAGDAQKEEAVWL